MVIRLEFTSAFEMLDLVQVVGDQVLRPLGLEEDAQQQVSMAIRESVINAILHGNQRDPSKHVFVEFSTENTADGCQLTVRVRDQGEGFDPASVPDPLALENLMKSSGRGMLMIRSFMEDVQVGRAPEGGTEVRMIKRIPVDSATGKQ